MLPDAIVFDLDDTILSDDAAAESAWRQVCGKFESRFEFRMGTAAGDTLLAAIRGVRRAYLTDFEYLRQRGSDLREARREVLATAMTRLGIEDAALTEEMVDTYIGLKSAAIELVPGAMDTLQCLQQAGIALALITNGPAQEQRAKVERAGLTPLFRSILIEGEFGIGKPHRRVYLHTLEQLNVAPAAAWMVGDNLVGDVGGAQAVGIYGVWVDWQEKGLPPGSPVKPDRIIRSIVELVE